MQRLRVRLRRFQFLNEREKEDFERDWPERDSLNLKRIDRKSYEAEEGSRKMDLASCIDHYLAFAVEREIRGGLVVD